MSRYEKGAFVRFLIDTGVLRFGEFILKSGLKSPFFLDLGKVCASGELTYIGECFAETIIDSFGSVDVLFAPPYKAIPLATATAIGLFNKQGLQAGICYHRKESKAHGEKGLFIGKQPVPGDRVLVIDDVLTTGATKIEALELLKDSFGVNAQGILVAVDRRAKGVALGLPGIELAALIDLSDIITYLRSSQSPEADRMERFYNGSG